MAISSYEDAEKIIKTQTKIVVQPCICRKEHEFIGEKCDYPVEAKDIYVPPKNTVETYMKMAQDRGLML